MNQQYPTQPVIEQPTPSGPPCDTCKRCTGACHDDISPASDGAAAALPFVRKG